jgi:hypothetical protein
MRAGLERCGAVLQRGGDVDDDLGSGRIAASEKETPNMLANMVQSG